MRPPSMPNFAVSRRTRILLAIVGALIVLAVIASSLTGVYINVLWYHSVGFGHVYSTVLWTRIVLFLIFGTLMALILGTNLVIAYLVRPPFRPMSPEQQNLERYRVALEPRRRLILAIVCGIGGFTAGMSAQNQWATWSLWLHGGSFGVKDPQFGRDISFFVWDYPAYRLLLGFGFTAIIFSFLLSLAVHYLTGAIRLQTPGPKVTPAARRHLTVLAFVFMLMKAIAYWLDRYGIVFSHRTIFTGASYTDVHASLPAKTILAWIALLIAALVLASLWLRSTLLPVIAFVAMLVLSILISGIYPAILQQVSVKPNASSKEQPYILRNIDATRAAYDIQTDNGVTYTAYPALTHPPLAAITPANPTITDIRVLDPNQMSPVFNAQQALRQVYGFADKLDMDRYDLGGVTRDYVVGIRELDRSNLAAANQTSWISQHTYYTHGYGFVAAPANTDITHSGAYTESDIPPVGPLGLTQPDVYFGELMPDYSIVGAQGTPREYNGTDPNVTYSGGGGVSLGSPLTRLAFAVQYKQTNFLLNDAVSAKGAHIIFNRDPRTMVSKVAPFLHVDSDPYPFVDQATGHVMWMVDAYTTLNNYPYSERNSLSSLTSDSLSTAGRTASQPNDSINYIRNSVKATIDAYTGKVTLYQWDPNDPVLNAWDHVFKGLVQPKTSMPAAVAVHVRYPEDMFEVQRSVLGTYHVSDPVAFYNISEKWTVPTDPTDVNGTANQPPYYVLASPPDGSALADQFQLTSPMLVNGKSYMAAYVSVDSDPGPNYGKFTVLTVPRDTQTNGPAQVFNILTTNPTISKDLTQFNGAGGGSSVVHGNLLTLPIGNSFLYVEPLYIQSTQASGSYPTLGRVLVVYGYNQVGYGPTLSDALANLNDPFVGRNLTGTTSIGGTTTTPTTTPTTSPSTSPSSSTTSPSSVDQVLNELDQAFAALQKAYASGDPVQVGQAEARIKALSQQYLSLRGSSTPSSTATSTPRSSPSATPSK
jgi:uncharacterized membrane protein (UPF0182 family)